MQSTSPDLTLTQHGCCGLIVLDKPTALNALNVKMVEGITHQLQAWQQHKDVTHVVLTGAGERAFCAGGDIRDLYDTGEKTPTAAPSPQAQHFFAREYQLDHRIHSYPKPVIALMNGITMGGGAGLAMHAHIRIAGAGAVFAMPENTLGFFPDVGATRFLNQCPGGVGLWLGLTGTALKGAELVSAGLAELAVPHNALNDILQVLQQPSAKGLAAHGLQQLLAPYTVSASDLSLRHAIDAVFEQPSNLAQVFAALKGISQGDNMPQAEHAAWANSMLNAMQRACPTSLAVCFQQLRQGKQLSVQAALKREFRMTMHALSRPDFYQGVKRAIIDRAHQPVWQPASLQDVTQPAVDAFFQPPACGDLTFPA